MKHRRIFLLLVMALLLCGCGKAEKLENPYRLKTTIHETFHNGEASPWRFENIYNENGYLMEVQEYENDVLDVRTLYEHDAYGNIVRTTAIHPDGTQNVGEDKLTLDKQHRVIYSESTWNGEPSATTEYGYNADGQITRLYINRIGSLHEEDWKSFVDRTYDRKGRLIREDTRWEPHDDNTSYTLYHYEQDRLLRTETYKEEILDSYTDYTYDETGLIQTAISYEADGTLQSKRVTTFDEYGNQILQERYRDGEVYWRTENIYELVETTSERS